MLLFHHARTSRLAWCDGVRYPGTEYRVPGLQYSRTAGFIKYLVLGAGARTEDRQSATPAASDCSLQVDTEALGWEIHPLGKEKKKICACRYVYVVLSSISTVCVGVRSVFRRLL